VKKELKKKGKNDISEYRRNKIQNGGTDTQLSDGFPGYGVIGFKS